jgi:ABC-type methionine transport system permease subunit
VVVLTVSVAVAVVLVVLVQSIQWDGDAVVMLVTFADV